MLSLFKFLTPKGQPAVEIRDEKTQDTFILAKLQGKIEGATVTGNTKKTFTDNIPARLEQWIHYHGGNPAEVKAIKALED